MIGGLLAANVASWIGLVVLDEVHPLPEVPAAAGSDVASLLYYISGFSILGLFVALLRVNARVERGDVGGDVRAVGGFGGGGALGLKPQRQRATITKRLMQMRLVVVHALR